MFIFIFTLFCAVVLLAAVLVVVQFARLEYRKDRIPIIIYHRIISNEDILLCKKASYVVSEANFEQQMRFLKDNGYTPIDLDEYLHYRKNRDELPSKPVIITFDDGYENNFLYAYPILKKYGFKAVIYSVSDPDAELFNKFEFSERLLSPEQMQELSTNGISIQGHTASHPNLKNLPCEDIRKELDECKKTIEAITLKPVVHMAIPFGYHDKRLFEIARDVGYKTIAVPGKGTINSDTDPFHLRRLTIQNSTTISQYAKIVSSPFYTIINRLYSITHLAIRKLLGEKIEEKVKQICARLGVDNPQSFGIIVAVVISMIIIYMLVSY